VEETAHESASDERDRADGFGRFLLRNFLDLPVIPGNTAARTGFDNHDAHTAIPQKTDNIDRPLIAEEGVRLIGR